MSWIAPTAAKLLLRLTPQEANSIKSLQGGMDTTTEFVGTAVAELIGYARAGGYPVNEADLTTLPLALHEDCYAIARWNLAISVPKLGITQTEERQKRYEEALKKGALIAAAKFDLEPVILSTPPEQHTGNWGSFNPLVMRTFPIPSPERQFQAPHDRGQANRQEEEIVGGTGIALTMGDTQYVGTIAQSQPPRMARAVITPPAGQPAIGISGVALTTTSITFTFAAAVPAAGYTLSWSYAPCDR